MATACAHQSAQGSQARAWNPKFTHSERERWVCVYPAYINGKKTVAEGRKIPKDKAVDSPTYNEIRDVLAAAGMVIGVENKVYPRERDCRDVKCRGRIRVQLRNDDGTAKIEEFPDRRSILLYLADMIPKLKARQGGSSGGAQATSQQQTSKKKKGKKK